jgi:hypothetical protein
MLDSQHCVCLGVLAGFDLLSQALKAHSLACSCVARYSLCSGLIGADGPEPNSKNFDPLGLAEKSPQNVKFYREAEIKVRLLSVS